MKFKDFWGSDLFGIDFVDELVDNTPSWYECSFQ